MVGTGEINLTLYQSISLLGSHILYYRDDTFGVSAEVHTTRNNSSHNFSKPRVAYALDGDIEEYETIEDVVDAINKRDRGKLRLVKQLLGGGE